MTLPCHISGVRATQDPLTLLQEGMLSLGEASPLQYNVRYNFNGMDMSKGWKRDTAKRSTKMAAVREKETR
jgi:hypothetical protein